MLHTPAGVTVINDAYNANPDSMRASLSTFAALEVSGRRIAVLGDMGELGDFAPALHEEVGAFAAGVGKLDSLVCVGQLAPRIAAGAQAGRHAGRRYRHRCGLAGSAFEHRARACAGDAVLVKASHFMGLARVVEGLVK